MAKVASISFYAIRYRLTHRAQCRTRDVAKPFLYVPHGK